MSFPDLYTEGIASGWKVIDAATLTAAQTLEADVAIIGSGAGGGVAAEILSQAGLAVLLVEEGPLKTWPIPGACPSPQPSCCSASDSRRSGSRAGVQPRAADHP